MRAAAGSNRSRNSWRRGAQLGPYKIEAAIGAGGMGEVYRACDTRLGREVAIKISAEEFSTRFEREARAVAALNHPNICTLHDVGPNYLVMELVQGDTLAARLKKGALPMSQVLEYGAQIADALAAAHAKGITHRDLKPGNIMLTKSGMKVLDFGLARMEGAPGETLTASHIVMGTPAYMAPEQREGKEADARSDIYSLGLVLYEMATGERAYEAAELRTLQPLALERVVKTCLAKDPDERFQSALDVKRILGWSGEPPAADKLPASRSRKLWSWFGWIAAALLVAIALWALWRTERSAAGSVAHLTMDVAPAEMLGPALTFSRADFTAVAFSPDGKTVVFTAVASSSTPVRSRLYKRALDQGSATAIPGTDGALDPFFSPDGQWVGFFNGTGKLKKVPLGGGPPVTICDVSGTGGHSGADWGSTGTIVIATTAAGLVQVRAAGGPLQALLKPDAARPPEIFYSTPHFLPDGKTLLFTKRSSTNWDEAQIVALRLDTGEQRALITGGADARYVPTGHLVFMQNGVLMAVPFDARRLKLAGQPVAMLDGVMQSVNMPNLGSESGVGQFAISGAGHLIYASGGIAAPRLQTLVRRDRKGIETELRAPKGAYVSVRVSPDGQRIAIARMADASLGGDIWVIDINTGISTRLTTQGTNFFPLWSLDGKRVFFSGGAGFTQLLSVAADGSGTVETAVTGKLRLDPASWNGKWLVYLEAHPSQYQIWTRPTSEREEPKRVVESEFSLMDGQLSPDGHWMAFRSNESGIYEVYVQAFPAGEKHRISTNGGLSPAWSRNGRELFYLAPVAAGKLAMMAVDFATGGTYKAGVPHELFEGDLGTSFPLRNYDVTPDGQFIMLRTEPLPDQRVTKLNVVLNWFEELKERAPR